MEIPYGYCQCGCGGKTWVPKHTDRKWGWIKGVPVRYCRGHRSPDFRGEGSSSWKGGKTKSSNGYIWVQAPGHPKNNHGYVCEHVIVMEAKLGMYMPEGAVVHHINRDRSDNRIENLMFCASTADHFRVHAEDRAEEACGHRHWKKCWICKQYDDPINMKAKGKQAYHPECARLYRNAQYKKHKDR